MRSPAIHASPTRAGSGEVADFELELKGDWDTLLGVLRHDDLQKRLMRQLRVANTRIGREFVARAKRLIRARAYEPNSPITAILKGSATPLVDRGDLMQSITYDARDPERLIVGVIRAKSGSEQVDIATTLHEGATIDVRANPRVRRAVWAKVRRSVNAQRLLSLSGRSRTTVVSAARQIGLGGRRGTPMTDRQRRAYWARQPKTSSAGGGKPIWRIPARPFILRPLNDPAFVRFVRTTWTEAIRLALAPKE